MSLESEKGGHLQETSDGFFPWNTEVSPFSHHPTLGLCLEIGYPWWITPFHSTGESLCSIFPWKVPQIHQHLPPFFSSRIQQPTVPPDVGSYKPRIQKAAAAGHAFDPILFWLVVQCAHLEKWWTSSIFSGWHPFFMTWKIIKIFQTTNQYIFTTAMLHDFWGFIPYKNEHVFFGKIIELNWGF